MIIHSNKLDVNKFKKDFVTLYRGEDKEQVLDRIIELISESDGSISSFLRKVDSVEDEKIQKRCRHAAIAQMYNVGLDYRCGSCYVETSASGEVIMIKLPQSTVILSQYGNIIFNEGEIWTQCGLNYGTGFITRKITDGQKKWGFINNYGDRVLPWIFDEIEGHVGELDIYYGKLCFELFTYGNIDFVGKDKLQEIIDDYDWRAFNCISEDNIIFSLNEMPESQRNKRHDPVNHDKLMEELRTALSPILVSKERLQDIVDSKKE